MNNNSQNLNTFINNNRPGAVEYNLTNDTEYYSTKYQLYKYEKYNKGWNDCIDAFRHAYGRAYTAYSKGEIYSNLGMTYHEIDGNIHNQDPKELNMDLWNNQVGKEIGETAKMIFKNSPLKATEEDVKNYIAEKVIQRMRAGDLITHLDDTRKFSNYHKIKARKEELIPKQTTPNRYSATPPISLLKDKKGFYKGFINDENGTDRIYSVENVGAMSDEEYNKTKNVLHAQIRKIGLPSNYELKRASSGGDVYVHSYTRGDGTHVTDYYRSRPNR